MKNVRLRSSILWLLPFGFFFCGYTEQAFAAEYYVDIKGADSGNGTQSSPWRTLQKALSSVAPDRGHTVKVGAGQYDLGGKVSVPSGLNLVGSGVGSTTIMGELQVVKVKDVTIRGIKFDGNNRKYGLGMFIRDANQLNIQDAAFNGYANEAINMERVSNSKIYNIKIRDSSHNNRVLGGGGKQTSSMAIGNLSNVLVDTIDLDSRARGGAGITSISDAWSKDQPWNSPSGVLKNVKFSNLNINVDQWSAWASGKTPQMALELWHQQCINCEISNSTFNSTVSLATDNSTRIHVHHNKWVGDNPYYAVEVDSDNIEFNHNIITGGTYPLAMFGKGRQRNNLYVHHNIFANTDDPVLLGNFLGKMNNLKIIANTIVLDKDGKLLNSAAGEAPDQQIRDNIFFRQNKGNNTIGAKTGVSNNLFYNVPAEGSGAVNADPKFALSGDSLLSYYTPTNGAVKKYGALSAGTSAWTDQRTDNFVDSSNTSDDFADFSNTDENQSRSSNNLSFFNKMNNSKSVPEPLTILGSATALSFGAYMVRHFRKKKI
ncbi:hypothetical protein WA1_16000 [Scytonema hofmannii PCC 7110]|uniref:DUF1565 domain-containing protein n=1 Tax=Scytonema hofmannii PCC 7110 TaxID=128403 RepID=A0A139XA82_9CYAN|nr:PEP-CTERM sorting domain-containing protein [Scytonema hofmannii]KYC41553.1 hypothetical protein WA1_16000 [Scytonema hofmannii PCC 7110]